MNTERRLAPPEEYDSLPWHWVRNHLGLTVVRWMPKIKDGIWEYGGFQARSTDSRVCDTWRYVGPAYPPETTQEYQQAIQAVEAAREEKAKQKAMAKTLFGVLTSTLVEPEEKPQDALQEILEAYDVDGQNVPVQPVEDTADEPVAQDEPVIPELPDHHAESASSVETVEAPVVEDTAPVEVATSPVETVAPPAVVDQDDAGKSAEKAVVKNKGGPVSTTPDAKVGEIWSSDKPHTEKRRVDLVEPSTDGKASNRLVHYVRVDEERKNDDTVVVTMERWKAWARRARALPGKNKPKTRSAMDPKVLVDA